MAPMWKEVLQARDEKRCELVLSGRYISERIEKDGLDPSIFQLGNLNFLEISSTCLNRIPEDIQNLSNLTSLVLRGNELTYLTPKIAFLKKLKLLDLSDNALEALPSELQILSDLQSLNVSCNKLSELPSLEKISNLVVVNFAHNEFAVFPSTLCDKVFTHLSEVRGNNNKISDIPSEINCLPALKILDLGNNTITDIPGELGDCLKLKELNLKGNSIKDKRLLKLVDQCHAKQVLEYVRSHCSKVNSSNTGTGKVSKGKVKSGKHNRKSEKDNELEQLQDQLRILHVRDEMPVVKVMPSVQDIRPFIVCCVARNVCLSEGNLLKRFITLQTKLHDTACEKRTIATLATHDFDKIQGNVLYDAKPPEDMMLMPLGRKKEVSAAELYSQLNEEAETVRKEKKRNTYSGIHKYLYLLKDKPKYPCLLDSTGKVISFPPITNSDGTKISNETRNILLEVTGNNLPTCKKVMDTLLEEMLKLGLGRPMGENLVSDGGDENKQMHLIVEQMRVVDEEGHLKVVYPSRTDLQLEGITVLRE